MESSFPSSVQQLLLIDKVQLHKFSPTSSFLFNFSLFVHLFLDKDPSVLASNWWPLDPASSSARATGMWDLAAPAIHISALPQDTRAGVQMEPSLFKDSNSTIQIRLFSCLLSGHLTPPPNDNWRWHFRRSLSYWLTGCAEHGWSELFSLEADAEVKSELPMVTRDPHL